jgi:hypothetical protein
LHRIFLCGNERAIETKVGKNTAGRKHKCWGGHAAAGRVNLCWISDFIRTSLCTHIQSDQKVSVHLMITIHLATWLNLTPWQPTARARGTLESH